MTPQANETVGAQKLPDEEWKFDDLSGHSDDCVRGIFLFEYFRYSDKLRKLVIRCREGLAPIWSPLSPLDEEWIWEATNGNEAFYPLVQQLKSCPGFPDTPALQIVKNGYPGASQTDSGKNWLGDLGAVGAVRLYGRETMDKDFETTDAEQNFLSAFSQLENKPGIEYHFKGNVRARAFESIFALGINWHAPDDQIVEDFRDAVLNRRPKQFLELAKIPSKQIAFGKFFGKLPFKPASALIWLGTLRRFQAAGESWKSFLELYDQPAKKAIKTGDRDFITWRQNQIEQRDKAKTVVQWLENGAAQVLDPKYFRK